MSKETKKPHEKLGRDTRDPNNTIVSHEGLPKISILLPVYNAEDSLDSSLRSIQRQSVVDWECIIVNDGSTDSSPAIAQSYAKQDSRFRLLDSSHIGLVAALNLGIGKCRGSFVARMDADDLMHSSRLEKQLKEMMDNPRLDAVACYIRLFPRTSLGSGLREYEKWLNSMSDAGSIRTDAFIECPVAHPSLFIKAKVLKAFEYRDKGWPEDYDLILRLLQNDKEISIVPERLLSWRNGPARMSMNHPSYSIEQFTNCKAQFLSQGFLHKHATYILWGYGKTGKALAKALAKLGHRPSYIIELHPGRLGNRIMGALVIPPEELAKLDKKQPVVVSVARPKPRSDVRAALKQMKFQEQHDYICAA